MDEYTKLLESLDDYSDVQLEQLAREMDDGSHLPDGVGLYGDRIVLLDRAAFIAFLRRVQG